MTRRALRLCARSGEPESGSIAYAVRTTFYGIPNLVANYLDKLLIFYLISPEAMASYYVAEKLPELLKRNVRTLAMVFIPKLSRMDHYTKKLDRTINVVSAAFALVILLVAMLVIPWLLPLIFSNVYDSSVLYCQILLVSVAIGLFATMKYSFILAKMDTKGFRSINYWSSCARILLALVLVPTLGLLGAAVSALLYRIVTSVTVQLNLRRHRMQEADTVSNPSATSLQAKPSGSGATSL